MTANSVQFTAHILPGWVATYYVRYGDRRLGPYHARVWKKNGKQHKEYIKPRDLERVRAACEAHRQRRLRGQEIGRQLQTVTGNLNYLLRMVKRSIKGTLRPEDHNHLAIVETQGPTAPGRPKLRSTRNFMVPSLTKVSPTLRGTSGKAGEGSVQRPIGAQMSDHSTAPSLTAHR